MGASSSRGSKPSLPVPRHPRLQARLYYVYSSMTFTFLPYCAYCLVLYYGIGHQPCRGELCVVGCAW